MQTWLGNVIIICNVGVGDGIGQANMLVHILCFSFGGRTTSSSEAGGVAAERLGGLITLKTFLEFARAVWLVCLSLVQCSVSLRNGCEDVCNFKLSPPPIASSTGTSVCRKYVCTHTHTHTQVHCSDRGADRGESRIYGLRERMSSHAFRAQPPDLCAHEHARGWPSVRPSVWPKVSEVSRRNTHLLSQASRLARLNQCPSACVRACMRTCARTHCSIHGAN